MNQHAHVSSVVPLSLKDAPSFIETQLPVGRLSAEAYKERKAGAGQTLTSLGSYWKGRKPLILVRATILGCLLPATDDHVADLRVFLMLLAMDDQAILRRVKALSPKVIDASWPRYADLVDLGPKPVWKAGLDREARTVLIGEWMATLPYDAQVALCDRPEDVDEGELLAGIWKAVNLHLGTSAQTIAELVEQLGIMRFGHRPKLADTFCGGGSIPFEAARIGCDVRASDLNPIACALTWGAFNVVGASADSQALISADQKRTAQAVDDEIVRLGIEHDHEGNRAKAYLYCLETKCPRTGWSVPMSPSWVISKTRNVVAKLVPVLADKRYVIEVCSGVSDAEMLEASQGTITDGRLVHPMNPDRDGVSIKSVRGDHRTDEGHAQNRLRLWTRTDFMPRSDDIFQERLYCIQWTKSGTEDDGRPQTFFTSVTEDDLRRERKVEAIVKAELARWQELGLVPSLPIQAGDKTSEPIRVRGWTYWHHLSSPRQLLLFALFKQNVNGKPATALQIPKGLDRASKLCRWNPGSRSKAGVAPTGEKIEQVFDNQALNPNYNYGCRSSIELLNYLDRYEGKRIQIHGSWEIDAVPAKDQKHGSDIVITDPPYADAVAYQEITEYLIAWLGKDPPAPFDQWTWDSRRELAIQGSDEKFRADMVAAYKAMTAQMPDHGIQVVMFTHQDAGVWADLAAIMWAAGLRVSAAWNIITETVSAQKQGNYVQGTILLVLRKRAGQGNAKRMDIEGEIEDAVDHQLRALNDLSHDWTSERLYTDGDLQLAAYAAALRVITNYETIDRVQVGADVYRTLKKGERTIIRDLIDYAAAVANNKLVPDGFPPSMWRDLDKKSRFYIRMLDMESKGSTKFADYQDFARTFSVGDYADLMANTKANQASLAGAASLKGGGLADEFGQQPLRRVLFATYKTMQKSDPKDGLNFLRLEYGADYWPTRAKLIEFARYLATKTADTRPDESAAADLLAQKLEVDRL